MLTDHSRVSLSEMWSVVRTGGFLPGLFSLASVPPLHGAHFGEGTMLHGDVYAFLSVEHWLENAGQE